MARRETACEWSPRPVRACRGIRPGCCRKPVRAALRGVHGAKGGEDAEDGLSTGFRPCGHNEVESWSKPCTGVWLSQYVRLHNVYTNTVDTVSKTRRNIPPLHELTISLHVRNIKTAIFQRFQICVLRSRVTANDRNPRNIEKTSELRHFQHQEQSKKRQKHGNTSK